MPIPTDETLCNALHKFFNIYQNNLTKQDKDLNDLVLDPMSVLLHNAFSDLRTKEDLLLRERWRRLDKAFSNEIGKFHETILATIPSWHKPEGGFDLRNDDKKTIVEIKNKHNTMNANSAKTVHEMCEQFFKTNRDWSIYVAQIIPRNGKINEPWKVSGRTTNEQIRLIDGATLYELVTEEKDALRKVYEKLPSILGKFGYQITPEVKTWFSRLYTETYQ